MSGPDADVLLHAELDADELLRFRTLAARNGWNSYLPDDDVELGPLANDTGYERIADSAEYDETWVSEAGFRPQARLWCSCATNRPESHRALADFAVLLAESFNGLIDLGGRFAPAQSLDGEARQVTSPVLTAQGPARATTLLVDAAWLRSWMRHPNFHMVK